MRPLHLALLLLITLIWGVNFAAAKFAVLEFPPLLSNAMRFGIVTIAFLPFLKVVPGRMRLLLWAALMLGVLHFGLMFIGLSTGADITAVAIVAQLNVPFVTLLAVFFLGEKVGLWRLSAIAVSFLGVAVLTFDPRVLNYLDAVVWITLSALAFAVATILMRRLKDVSAMTTQAWVALAGFIGSGLATLVAETGQIESISQASYYAFGGVAFSAFFSSIIGHSGMNQLLRTYDVSVVSPYLLLMPLFAVVSGILIFDDPLTTRVVVGGGLTLFGVMVVTLRNAQQNMQATRTRARIAANSGA